MSMKKKTILRGLEYILEAISVIIALAPLVNIFRRKK